LSSSHDLDVEGELTQHPGRSAPLPNQHPAEGAWLRGLASVAPPDQDRKPYLRGSDIPVDTGCWTTWLDLSTGRLYLGFQSGPGERGYVPRQSPPLGPDQPPSSRRGRPAQSGGCDRKS